MKVKEESEKAGLKLNIQKSKVTTPGLIPSQQIDGETVGTVTDFYFLGLQNHCKWWLQTLFQKKLAPWKKGCGKSRQCIKKQRHHFANKVLSSQSYGFSSSHVWMWELDYKEGWATPMTAACQASLSITNSRSLLKLMPIEWVMPSNHLILCHPLLPPSIFPSIRVFFKWVSSSHEAAKVLEFQLQNQAFQGTPRTDLL